MRLQWTSVHVSLWTVSIIFVFASGSSSSGQAYGRAQQVRMEWMNEWMSALFFLAIRSWNGHYRMLVMEPDNARVQWGLQFNRGANKGSERQMPAWRHFMLSGAELGMEPEVTDSRRGFSFHSIVSPTAPSHWVVPLFIFFYFHDLFHEFSCELPAALRMLVSLTSVWAPMGKTQVWYFSISQEQGRVQIGPRFPSTKPLLKGDGPESQNFWLEELPKIFQPNSLASIAAHILQLLLGLSSGKALTTSLGSHHVFGQLCSKAPPALTPT